MNEAIFGDFADEYERHRPDYPAAMWSTLLDGESFRDVIDLGCGTGRATRELARRGLRVVGVEPESGMLAEAATAARREGLEITWQEAPAESTGRPEASADLVVAAQAFHWFDPELTRREVARVLRPGGTFAVWWNDRIVDGVAWMEEYEALIERFNPAYQRGYRDHDWRERLVGDGLDHLRYDEFNHGREVDADGFVALAFTSSYVRKGLSPETQTTFEAALREVLSRHHAESLFEIPYCTRLYRLRSS